MRCPTCGRSITRDNPLAARHITAEGKLMCRACVRVKRGVEVKV